MRNLQVFRNEWVHLQLEKGQDGEVMVAAAYDADHERIFFGSNSCTIFWLSFASMHQCVFPSWGDRSNVYPVGREKGEITCMEFLLEKEVLVIGFASGLILELDPSSRRVEEVGKVKGGVVNMSLSPDGEQVMVATGLRQLLLMTQDWDLLYEIPLNQPLGSSGTSKLIHPRCLQISWRGDGKYFCTLEVSDKSPNEERNDTFRPMKVWESETGTLHSTGEQIANLEPALSWSPAGARIATAYCRPEPSESLVVVLFERNGLKRSSFNIHVSPGAKVKSLHWNANSELLAIVISCVEQDLVQVWNISNFRWYLKKEWQVPSTEEVEVFWDPERPLQLLSWTRSGCLRRITLCWKSAVIGESTAFVIDGKNLLVTCLSVSIIPPPMFLFKVSFPSPVQTVATFFDSTSRCLIAAGLSDGSFSVIVLPGVETWDDLEGEEFAASPIQSDPLLDFGKFEHISWLGSESLVGSVRCGLAQGSNDFALRLLLTGVRTFCPVSSGEPGKERLVEVKLLCSERCSETLSDRKSAFCDGLMLRLVKETVLDQALVAIAASPLNRCFEEARKAEAFLQLADGSVLIYTSGGSVRKPDQSGCSTDPNLLKFASPSPWMEAVIHGSGKDRRVVLISFDEQGRLQVNDRLVSSDCTSFTLHESIGGNAVNKVTHLVFTTRLELLHVLNLEEIFGGSFLGEEVMDITSLSSSRKLDHPTTLVGKSRASKLERMQTGVDSLKVRPLWERGARLVSTLGSMDVAVILQTIRGNLETIYPRGLVLGAVATALIQENFKDAVLLGRRHHIDLNVIVDYKGWQEFCQTAESFVEQVGSLGHVTEVVQAVSKENVMETTYKNLIPVYWKLKDGGSQQTGLRNADDSRSLEKAQVDFGCTRLNKVQGVLCAIRSALQKVVKDSPARELCILTTLARSDPPELEAALERIRTLREAEIKEIDKGDISSLKDKLSAEAAVKHLIWLTDADIVFDVALGLYDLHLAAMVAAHSQKDPKEFLPLLEALGNMPDAQMRYEIDCRLRRFESALLNCADMGPDHFTDCIQLMRANPALFRSGAQIFQDVEKRTVVLDAWGDHLVEEEKFEDAGATFCACSRFDKALAAYRMAGLWTNVMMMAGRLGKTSDEIVELAVELRDELQAMGRPREAAKLALDYCGDVEGAIMLLLDAHDWLEVARLAYLHNKRELVSSHLDPAVLDSANFKLKELDEVVEKVGKYLARFLAIHQRRLLLSAKLKTDQDGREAIEDDASSDISLASSSTLSNVSGLSAYTYASTRQLSTTSSVNGAGGRRHARAHKGQGGRIRAGSPGEELALVEHLKGMALGKSALEDYRLLLQALLQLGHESTARCLQQAVSHFITVQLDAVRQTEERMLEEAAAVLSEQKLGLDDRTPHRTLAKEGLVQRALEVQWQLEVLK